MGFIKNMLMDISHELGQDGDINPIVQQVADEVMKVHDEKEAQRKAMLSAGIGRLMRDMQDELFADGKIAMRVCSWCQAEGRDGFMGYTQGSGITHGICREHAEMLMSE